MQLITPGIGLVFWMLLSFSILLYVLTKFAWKPILRTLKEREKSIENALLSADKAKAEMAKLQANNEKILAQSRIEREEMLKEARQIKDKIIADAKGIADAEAKKIVDSAKHSIENEKKAAINEIKAQIATLSVSIAEKIIKHQLDNKQQQQYINTLLDDLKMN